ncbi:MAG: hypothetical protein EOQ56_30770 [Mesorhizobium sp.]|nr:MAG: hypothetical protein EOQ56_30770 [Mesorhizobium sp.]
MQPKFSIDEARLDRYLAASEAAFEVSRGISADIRHCSEERMRLQSILDHKVRDYSARTGFTAEEAPETAKIEDLSRKIKRLENLRETQGERTQHLGRIAEACREYALPRPGHLGLLPQQL